MIKPEVPFEGISLSINTHNFCNHKCSYCYERNRPVNLEWEYDFWNKATTPDGKRLNHRVTMPTNWGSTNLDGNPIQLEYIKKFYDYMLKSEDPLHILGTEDEWLYDKGAVLDFIGGDSMQYPELLHQSLKYWAQQMILLDHKWQGHWRASVSSNGTTLLDPRAREVAEYWKDVMSLGISIDGCPELHDSNRHTFANQSNGELQGSWQFIEKIIPWWQKHFPHNAQSSKWTLGGTNYHYIMQSVKFMYDVLGIKYIQFNRAMEDDIITTPSDIEIAYEQFSELVQWTLERDDSVYISPFSYHFFAKDVKSLNECMVEDPNFRRCGYSNMPTLAHDGHIYTCFRLLPAHLEPGSTYNLQQFSAGHINDLNPMGNKENILWLREDSVLCNQLMPEKCKICPILSSCPSCAAGNLIKGLSVGKKKHMLTSSTCEWAKLQIIFATKYWLLFNAKHPENKDYPITEKQAQLAEQLDREIHHYIKTGEYINLTNNIGD